MIAKKGKYIIQLLFIEELQNMLIAASKTFDKSVKFSSFERKFINQLHVHICFMSIFIHYSLFKIESKNIFQYLQYQLLLNNLESTAIQRLNWNKWHKTTNVKWTRMNRLADICVPPLPFLFYSLLTLFHNHKN